MEKRALAEEVQIPGTRVKSMPVYACHLSAVWVGAHRGFLAPSLLQIQ